MSTEDPSASRGGSPIDHDDDDNDSSNFTDEDTNFVLNLLIQNPAAYMSGNGFKKKAYTTLSDKLNARFRSRPARSKDQVRNRIAYVKRIFELYEFVRGKSGVGWDDENKMASAETEYIDRFIEEYGKKFKKCFEKTCPFYDRLTQLFGGNKATGANVLHLKRKKAKKPSTTTSSTTGSSSATASSSLVAAPSSTVSTRKPDREPFSNLDNDLLTPSLDDYDSQNIDLTPSSPKPHNDELLPPPPKRSHHSRTTIEISDEENDEKPAKRSRHDRSNSGGSTSTSGGRRASRNAEAGNEIARGLKSIGEGMSAPLITKADTSHVDEVIELFSNDPTLLPDDPEGEHYALLLDVLGSNEKRARALVKTTNPIHRIALLKRIFAEQEVTVNWN
ncbi:hypothetical protein K438DRAFT_2026022 [Mycena galopus ATCC 62051]|nr:hypothetical protein K438DRAFT_2026022 [Mycena galopus ATCC 62051]